ncbi:MAG: PD40 domain-containing protein [Pseudomonadota bacterium]|nr:MAG: PD40 domain-containing protein [Pseudomonadota bacterium]
MTKILVLVICAGLAACNRPADSPVPAPPEQTVGQETGQTAGEAANAAPAELSFEGETHLANIKQLTFGGQNAEAYFSHDGTELIFQSTRGEMQCDAIFRMNADGSNVRQVSSGQGATTCSFIAPDGKSIIYASTHLGGKACPPKPDHSRGYVWALYDSYDIFRADPEGGNAVRLTDTPGYDAEAVYSPRGDKIVFTSVRTGDLELFLMDPDGSGVEQLTDQPGYDGGAFFSLDGEWLVWRASRPEGDDLKDYRTLLAEGLIRPGKLEIYIMNLAERKPIQITDNGAANFGPYWHPDGKHITFVSNVGDPKGRNFDLYLVNIDTRKTERITHFPGFDGFPMFSHDGSQLVFASNRNNAVRGETNVFIADWQ